MSYNQIFHKYPKSSRLIENEIEIDLGNEQLNLIISELGGFSIQNGIFKVHTFQDSSNWYDLVVEAFPKYKSIGVFGMDWMGRQYACSLSKELVYMFDISTGEDLVLEQSLSNFFVSEIPEYGDEMFDPKRFELINDKGKMLEHSKIFGFKVPLWLGGQDDTENLEKIDAEVDWEINRQLFVKIKG